MVTLVVACLDCSMLHFVSFEVFFTPSFCSLHNCFFNLLFCFKFTLFSFICLICRWLMYIFCCIACLIHGFWFTYLVIFYKKIQIVASLFSIASLVWFFSHSWMMMKFLLWYVFWLSLSCSKCFSNKTCESFLKLWKLVSNQHFLFDVYPLHCCCPCFAQLFVNFMFKCFRFKSWPCCHWVKPRSTTCFFQFLITKYDDGRWVDFRKLISI
jgi:hypothetical protein